MLFVYSGTMVRFDKPCKLASGAVDYFREHMEVGDYLTQGGSAEMTWFGQGAGKLGMNGICQLDHFERLCLGQHPVTGEKLLVRDKVGRRVCFFGQISAPKDVSVALLVGGDTRLAGWWQDAVKETLVEMESVAAARVRRAGTNADRTTGNMIAAVVTHDASRALDPQLHTHVCVMNLTFDEVEQRWKGLQPDGLFRQQSYFREVCYNKLAERMLSAGYELERARGLGFTIKGFPAELRERFSKRRHTILKEAAATGATTQDALHSIAGHSRAAKSKATARELTAGWRTEAGDALNRIEAVIASADGSRLSGRGFDAAGALAYASDHLFERRSVVEPHELLREALSVGRGNVALSDLKTEVEREIAAGSLIRVKGEIASREALAAEKEFVDWAAVGRRQCAPLGAYVETSELGEDQRTAVAQVLGSVDRVIVLQGDAGTGKTTCLRTIVAGIESSGGRVFGCAPSAGAADVLRKELTAEADTLQQLLVNERLQESAQGRVVLVDEAGLVSVRQMRDLCRLAARHEWRLLLVGDTKQHSSVEAGDALRCLQRYAGLQPARLTQIRRQRDREYRAAVAALAKGEAWRAFAKFSRLGAIQEIKSEAAMFRAAAAAYLNTISTGQSCLAIAPVWKEIETFTGEVRSQLRTAGLLGAAERSVDTMTLLPWTRAETRRVENYQPGNILVFHRSGDGFAKDECATVLRRVGSALVVRSARGHERRVDPAYTGGFSVGVPEVRQIAVGERLLIQANARSLGLRNGDLAEVAGFDDDGSLRLRDGRNLPPTFRQFTHGYATTSHAAQGKTVDHGILIMAADGIAAGNLKQAYVSNSRFRESQLIFTTDTVAAREAMERTGDRKLVLEAIEAEEPAAAAFARQRFAGLQTDQSAVSAARIA